MALSYLEFNLIPNYVSQHKGWGWWGGGRLRRLKLWWVESVNLDAKIVGERNWRFIAVSGKCWQKLLQTVMVHCGL
jgi:hypothetical protein